MNTINANVLRGVMVPAGQYLDGALVEVDTWVKSGTHEFDADFAAAQQWDENGYIEPTGPKNCCCS